jgi:hypothetical protein
MRRSGVQRTVLVPADKEESALISRKNDLRNQITRATKELLLIRSDYEKQRLALIESVGALKAELSQLKEEMVESLELVRVANAKMDDRAEALLVAEKELKHLCTRLSIQGTNQEQREGTLRSKEAKLATDLASLNREKEAVSKRLQEAKEREGNAVRQLAKTEGVSASNERHRQTWLKEELKLEELERRANEASAILAVERSDFKAHRGVILSDIQNRQSNLARWEKELTNQKQYQNCVLEEIEIDKAKLVNEKTEIQKEYRAIKKVKDGLKYDEAKLKEKKRELEYRQKGILDG